MKNRIQPTDRERVMREGDFIVSKTDTKGRVTYSNEIFMEFAGLSEAELLGQQHNIIRHPDMPRGVFKYLWDTIASGKEVFAYVKNMSSDGGFYWVLANVTPDYDEAGRISGYFSVRRAPSRQAVAVMDDLYRQMRAVEAQAGPRDAPQASLDWLAALLEEKGVSYEQFVLSL